MNTKIALAAALAALVLAGCAKKEEAVQATQEAAADGLLDGLAIEPHLPARFTHLTVTRVYRGATYHITMDRTGHLLGRELTGKTVVLVGAMVPFSFVHSDALFNLGCAFIAVQAMPRGVYVTMNGKVFSWDDVRKNKAKSEFEPLN